MKRQLDRQVYGSEFELAKTRPRPEPVARVLGFDGTKPSLVSPGAPLHDVGIHRY